MAMIELNPTFREGYGNYGDYYKHWWPSKQMAEALRWLDTNVGKIRRNDYQFPFFGEGWIIFHGYNEDPRYDDWAWRNLTIGYKPKGKLGYWLKIDDDAKAVELMLTGLLDGETYTGEIPHHCSEVQFIRRRQEGSDYPKSFRRQ